MQGRTLTHSKEERTAEQVQKAVVCVTARLGVPADALERDSIPLDGFEVLSSSNNVHFATPLRQPDRHVSPDPTSAYDSDRVRLRHGGTANRALLPRESCCDPELRPAKAGRPPQQRRSS